MMQSTWRFSFASCVSVNTWRLHKFVSQLIQCVLIWWNWWNLRLSRLMDHRLFAVWRSPCQVFRLVPETKEKDYCKNEENFYRINLTNATDAKVILGFRNSQNLQKLVISPEFLGIFEIKSIRRQWTPSENPLNWHVIVVLDASALSLWALSLWVLGCKSWFHRN